MIICLMCSIVPIVVNETDCVQGLMRCACLGFGVGCWTLEVGGCAAVVRLSWLGGPDGYRDEIT